MASSKRKQDEKHLKMLREVVALAHNKQCFDCHQRGPTYINMTIGSFVCTACSGLLRGLNPPHRVKSISMASFTPEEMDFIKCHGNEFCRRVWLGLYDNRLGSQSESRDETKVKDFMVQKYERKRYYVAPTDTMKEEAKKMNESAISKTPGTKPLKSLLGDNAPKLQVTGQEGQVAATFEATFTNEATDTGLNSTATVSQNPFAEEPAPAPVVAPASDNPFADDAVTEAPVPQNLFSADLAQPTNTAPPQNLFSAELAPPTNTAAPQNLFSADIAPPTNTATPQNLFSEELTPPTAVPANVMEEPKPVSATPPPIGSTPQSPGNQSLQSSKSSGSTAMDLLGDLGGDPFASSAPAQPQGGFADFGNFGSSAPAPAQPTAFPASTPLQPAGSNVAAPQQPAFNGFGAPPSSAPAPAAPVPGAGGDKYSNLTDLFSMGTEEAETSTTSTGWSSTVNTPSGGGVPGAGVNWNSSSSSTVTAPSGGINWGGDSNSQQPSNPNPGGVNWNSSSAAPQQPPAQQPGTSGGMSWGGGGSTGTSSWGAPAPATAQSNGLGNPGNPFLLQNNNGNSPTVQPLSNPFGGGSNTSLSSQSAMPGGMPGAQPQANPFGGQPGAQPGAGFGAQPGSGQPGAGFGAQPGGGQPGAGFGAQPGAQPGGFGGFGAPQSSASGFGQFGAPGGVSTAQSGGAAFGQMGVQNGGFGNPNPQTSSAAGFGQGFGGAQQGFGQPAQPQQPQQGAGGFGGMPGAGGAGFGAQQGFGAQGAPQGAPGGGFPGQQMQGFGAPQQQQQQQQQQAQQAGGWGQQAAPGMVNPFMSTAQQQQYSAPKSGATNPFL